jgi:hypothetical protein
MPGSSARQLALALALGAVLAACSDDGDKPQVLPSITTPSPTPSQSPAPSFSPTPSTAITADGASAFVRAYYSEVNRAAATGKTDVVKGMIARECPCQALIKYIEDSYKVGSLRGFTYSIRDVTIDDFRGRVALATVTYSVGRIEEISKTGKVTGVVPPVLTAQKAVTVIRAEDKWLIDNVHNLGAP